MMNRRDFYRIGTIALGNLVALVLAVPGVAYLLDPLRRKREQGEFRHADPARPARGRGARSRSRSSRSGRTPG